MNRPANRSRRAFASVVLVASCLALHPARCQALGPAAGGGAAATAGEFAPAPMRQQQTRDLRELLALAEGDLPLRVTLASRDQVMGHPWRVFGDTLQLVPPRAYRPGQSPRAGDLVPVFVADIMRLEQARSGARTGAGWGAKTGAIVVGGLGLLVGAAVAGLSESDEDVGPIAGFAIVGIGAGALVGGGIGAGVGALGRSWITLWPQAEAGASEPGDLVGDGRRAHFLIEGGWSVDDRAEVDGRGPGVRLGLMRRLSGAFEMGPVAEFHDLEGRIRYDDYYGWYPEYPYEPVLASRNRMFSLGLDVRANGQAGGVRVLGTTGLGWCLSDELYIGANAGIGLRRRAAGGQELSLVVRRHFEVTGIEPHNGRFWSVAAGFTFGD